jgi:hypothetical protein
MERSSSSNGQWIPYPPGESSAAKRWVSVAAANLGEHFSQGINSRPSSSTTTKPSRVGSILLAISGSVAFTFLISKNFPPLLAYQIEVIEDDLSYLSPQ